MVKNTYSQGIDWSEFVEMPCTYDNETQWEGPKEQLVCGICESAPACCVTVVYYDRWYGPDNKYYDISIAGIYWTGSTPCCDLTLNSLMQSHMFYIKLLTAIHGNTNTFRNKLYSSDRKSTHIMDPNLEGSYIYKYTKAKCKSLNEYCESNDKCCKIKVEVVFGTTQNLQNPNHVVGVYSDVANTTFLPDDICPPPCEISCNEIPFERNPKDYLLKSPCDSIPCNDAPWTTVTSDNIPMPGMSCKYTVTYRKRVSACNPGFTDIEIIDFFKTPNQYPPCIEPSMMASVKYRLIELGVLKIESSSLAAGECFDKYEFRRNACWTLVPGGVSHPDIYTPCGNNCCWALYTVCKAETYPYDMTYSVVAQGESPECPIENNLEPCQSVCGYGSTQGQLKTINIDDKVENPSFLTNSKFNIIPNPANSKIELYLQSNDNGLINIVISNQSGKEVYSIDIEKTSLDLRKQINTNNLPNGTYFVTLKNIINNEIYKDSFIIIH